MSKTMQQAGSVEPAKSVEQAPTVRPVGQLDGGRKLFVKTYGCQMNVYDTDRMTELLAMPGADDGSTMGGYTTTDDMAQADHIVLNTCHIREKAADKVYSDLGRVAAIRDARALLGLETIVTVAGCVAQAEGAEIVRRAPVVDLVVGPQSYHRLPELLGRVRQQRSALSAMGFYTAQEIIAQVVKPKGIVALDFPDDDKFQHLPPVGSVTGDSVAAAAGSPARQPSPRRSPTAFLTVQEGCDKFCTFCVVPYTRGAEYSRPMAQVLDEARRLADQGVREITLLGQNVNAYHGAGADGRPVSLAHLLERLSTIDGIERLRYTTSHPRDMTDDLIAAHRDLPKLMPYLHLPFQAGSDRALAAMNRKHTAKDYLVLIERIRDIRPDIALSTDIIVGFPGETDADFAATLGIVRHVGFAQAYSFKYSARPGTPAASIEHQVPDHVRRTRLATLQALLLEQQTRFNQACVGRALPVLFEKVGRNSGQLIGRSPYLQSVHAAAEPQLLGRIVTVDIVAAGPNSLSGVIKAQPVAAKLATGPAAEQNQPLRDLITSLT